MTTANKITLLRIMLIPVMLIVIEIPQLKQASNFLELSIGQLAFAIIFIFAALTDFLDGYIARRFNQITTFGKFLDPIADKMLVFVGLMYLMIQDPNRIMLWSVVVILIREFAVTGIRLLAVQKDVVIAASPFGKAKTVTTMIALTILLFNDFGMPVLVGNIIYYLAVALTIISGVDYFIKSRKVVLESL